MMINWLIQIVVNAITLLIIAHFSQRVYIAGIGTAILASFILSLVNIFVKPLLILVTLPITVLTFGLFLFFINVITLMITSALMGSKFVIDGLGTAIVVSIVFALLSSIINHFIVDPLLN